MEPTNQPSEPTPKPGPSLSLILTALVAFIAWGAAAASCISQKRNADKTIADSFDISAIQIQQLNGSVTSHTLVAIVIAMALSMPLLIVGVYGASNKV